MNTTASKATPASAPAIWIGVSRQLRALVEIIFGEVMMRLDLVGLQFGGDAPQRDDISALGELERERGLLLHQQDAESAAIEFAERLQNVRRDFGRETKRGLVEHQQFRPGHQGAAD